MNNRQFHVKNLYIELTSKCNLYCKHCYNSSGNVLHELPFHIIERIITDGKKMGLDFVSLSGGEPLLHKNIWDILDLLDRENIFFLLISNGTCINDQVIDKMQKYKCNIQLSLDGADSYTHDSIRGVGNFEKSIHNVEKLMHSGFGGKLVIKSVITNYMNENEQIKFMELAQKLNASKVEFGWLNRTGRGEQNYNELFIGKHKIQECLDMFEKNAIKNSDIEITDIGYTDKCPLEHFDENSLDINPKITYEGDVYPCQMFIDKEYSLGNVYNTSLHDCIFSDKFSNLLCLLSLRGKYMHSCLKCIHKANCAKGCPALSVNQGSLFETDEFCEVRKKRFIRKLSAAMNKTE